MTINSKNLIAGAKNLLFNCAELAADETVLIVKELPSLGWYDAMTSATIIDVAGGSGIVPTEITVGAPDNDRDPMVAEGMAAHDCTIFLARIGDQDRFAAPITGKKTVMSYARTAKDLASNYGRCDHRALVGLKQAVNEVLLSAKNIRITCPLGTDLSGDVSNSVCEAYGDVSVRRFPLGVPQPIEAAGMSGRVALSRYLTPTGSRTYSPPSLRIDGVVMAEISNGRILKLLGEATMVDRIRQHHEMVAKKFDIDADAVHSFHAGIHPGSAYTIHAGEDPDRWSNSIFTNPRILHFHTCGTQAPGEICWILVDHTLTIDGANLWENGRLCAYSFEETRSCLESWPELGALVASPSRAIGLND